MNVNKLKEIERTLKSHPFITPRFLQNAHIQTLFPRLIPYFKIPIPKAERRFIKLDDGSQLAADCWFQPDKEKHETIVILTGYEGYVGSKVSRFSKNMRTKAYYLGHNVIHLRQRAEGDTIHLTKSIGYIPHDIPIAFEQIAQWSTKKIFLIGFSIGGYNMLFGLGKLEKKAEEYISGAVAISAPTTIADSWEHIEKNPLYDRYLMRFYKNLIRRRAKIDPPGTWDLKQLQAVRTKRQFGEIYMNKWGYAEKFSSLEDINRKTDVMPHLKNIKIPTLIIHAYDDPLISVESFTKSEVQNNPNIITLLTKHGGHGGFFTTKKLYGDLDGHWAQNRALEFIQLLEK